MQNSVGRKSYLVNIIEETEQLSSVFAQSFPDRCEFFLPTRELSKIESRIFGCFVSAIPSCLSIRIGKYVVHKTCAVCR